MEVTLKTEPKKRRASVFDCYEEEVKSYLALGINYSSIHKLISAKMSTQWGYNGFYRWILRTIVTPKREV